MGNREDSRKDSHQESKMRTLMDCKRFKIGYRGPSILIRDVWKIKYSS